MKNVVFTLLQSVLFLIVFGAFSLFPPFHIEHVIHSTATSTRIFIADGLVLMLALYVVILLIEALRKRLPASALWSSLALVLAAVVGFLMKFGLLTRSTY
jgi:uncharacterized PurR-regulated membrane protein YhhQ (DUF165 family)